MISPRVTSFTTKQREAKFFAIWKLILNPWQLQASYIESPSAYNVFLSFFSFFLRSLLPFILSFFFLSFSLSFSLFLSFLSFFLSFFLLLSSTGYIQMASWRCTPDYGGETVGWNKRQRRLLDQQVGIICIETCIRRHACILRQEAWITHRASSTTTSRKNIKKKKKISNKTNKNDSTLETAKKEVKMQKQNWGRHR